MKIVIGIATTGRPDILTSIVRQLSKQTRLPDCLYICPAAPKDYDRASLEAFPAPMQIVEGSRGLTRQRNAILRAAVGADIIVFFDDDFLADPNYLDEIERLFTAEQDLVVATGHVLADGILGPGITVSDGLGVIEDYPPTKVQRLRTVYNGYGCNMAIKLAVVRLHSIEFDENLPLYGWWEDVDFCRRIAPYGRICKSNAIRGVHLGSKSGRTPGKRLGYSQVANVLYLRSRGVVSWHVAFNRVAMNVAANFGRSFFPEPWVDRRGRLAGNALAFYDLARGKLAPQNIELL